MCVMNNGMDFWQKQMLRDGYGCGTVRTLLLNVGDFNKTNIALSESRDVVLKKGHISAVWIEKKIIYITFAVIVSSHFWLFKLIKVFF